ncbi:MAG: hypothetical protein ACI9H6_000320, partial [Patiriisocius sp.]
QYLLSYTPLPWNFIMYAVGTSVLSLVTIELGKFFFYEEK